MPARRPLIALVATALLALPATAAAAPTFLPNDPGKGTTPGGWQTDQWNFAGPYGVNALGAWRHLIAAGRPGGAGVTVAVIDSGIAYRNVPPFKRSPDLQGFRFVQGHDFVDDDPYADDQSGHGTHVASTIGEATNNAIGLTGLAYGVKLMPVRVLDRFDQGDSADVAKGVRWAAAHGANVINISIEFSELAHDADLQDVVDAIAYAHQRGAVVVASAGNTGVGRVALPGRARYAIAVGATTEHGCLSSFSDVGSDLDLVAPGGGDDADFPDDPRCDSSDDTLRDVYQETLVGKSTDQFGFPSDYAGTSMAAPHVAAAAALVIASGVIGAHPTPEAVELRLEATARDLGRPGRDNRYGWGLLDAEAATRKGPPVRTPPPAPPARPAATALPAG